MNDEPLKPHVVITHYEIKTTASSSSSSETSAPKSRKKTLLTWLIVLLLFIPFAWFVVQPFIITPFYSMAVIGPNVTTDFIIAANQQDEAKLQTLLSSELRARYKPGEYAFLSTFTFSHVDWGNRRSYGTTRGGKNIMSLSGYVKFEGRKEESSFSATLMEENGVWLINSISIQKPAVPR